MKFIREVMLTFPDLSKPFHIYTDASDKQLGAVITRDENLLHFIVENLIVPIIYMLLVNKNYFQL
jgi:hypothetical protein